MEQFIRDLVNGLIDKTNKQDELNAKFAEKLNDLDKKVDIRVISVDSKLEALRTDVDNHPVNCPANKTEVRRMVHEVLNSRELEKTMKKKADVVVAESVKTSDATGLFAIWKHSHPIERFIILLIALYFILDKVGVIDKLVQ